MNSGEYRALFEVEDRHWWFVALRREIARALETFGKRGADFRWRWLDAGSGTGGLLANLDLPREGMHAGVEVSFEAMRFARSRELHELVLGSVTALPFGAEVFDVVTSVDVLCHRDVNEEPALSEAHRCLKRGGLLVLQVPAFDWLKGEHDAAVWTNRRYRRREVETMLRRAGFEIAKSFYRVGLVFPAVALRRFATRGRPRGESRSDVRPAAPWLDGLLGAVLGAESSLGRLGLRLPFGLSVFCVARKGSPEERPPRAG